MNLDPFNMYSEADLWTALESVNMKEFVNNQKDKLNTNFSEGGDALSVGQRQLLCLARALLRRTQILVLDEATASVDQSSDELIQQTLRKSFAKCTILTIAHRINTIIDYTKIMVIDNGSLVEFDRPEKLLARKENSLFYKLVEESKNMEMSDDDDDE